MPSMPALMMGLINENEVPWMQSKPVPMGPTRWLWMKVAMPETKSDMETRNPVVWMSKRKADAMMRGGVMMATKMAKRCCKAANKVSRRGGRSLSP